MDDLEKTDIETENSNINNGVSQVPANEPQLQPAIQPVEVQKNKNKASKKWLIALAFVVLICLIGGGLYWYFNSTNKPNTAHAANNPTPVTKTATYTSLQYTYDNKYTLPQAMSDQAQLSTIAFDGLAFVTGSAGADTFFPPGKVADYFGFQYMRDVDKAGFGHNTTFLPKAADNILTILTSEQKAKLVTLAKQQAPIYANFAYNRYPLMVAFRNNLDGKLPSGSSGLSTKAVETYTGNLYGIDYDLAYNRALVTGSIINSFTTSQKASLAKLQFNDSSTWADVPEDQTLKKSLTNDQYTAIMTYASEMLSWYKGGLNADTYFCPERHGTYFGGFFMKDYAAVGNSNYFISTKLTGDSGQGFLNNLDSTQKQLITSIPTEQKTDLQDMAQTRMDISSELRKAMTGGTPDKTKVAALVKHYGELDGKLSTLYAFRFAQVKKTLTAKQLAAMVTLRNLNVVPTGGYYFSTPVPYPAVTSTNFLFGVGTAPANAGNMTAPSTFSSNSQNNNPPKP